MGVFEVVGDGGGHDLLTAAGRAVPAATPGTYGTGDVTPRDVPGIGAFEFGTVYVWSGVGGDGSQASPFDAIATGIIWVPANGLVLVDDGNYDEAFYTSGGASFGQGAEAEWYCLDDHGDWWGVRSAAGVSPTIELWRPADGPGGTE